MGSTKFLFNRINNYLSQMCNSVDEIKGNYMKRYLLRAMIKRDISINNIYRLDCQTESLIEEFFINIFIEYVNEMEKILNKTRFFKNFYKKYMADSIKLANSRDFLDHSSLDAIMLPIEASLFRFFNYGESIENNKLRNKIICKIYKKINRIKISFYDFHEDLSNTYMKFKDLFNKKTFKTAKDAWNELKKYVIEKYTDSTKEEIIIDEQKHSIKVITKDTTNLAMDRYVPIKSPVNIQDLDANVK